MWLILLDIWDVDIVGVGSSILPAPTILGRKLINCHGRDAGYFFCRAGVRSVEIWDILSDEDAPGGKKSRVLPGLAQKRCPGRRKDLPMDHIACGFSPASQTF